MVNATALVKSFITTPTENTYILFRIEFLVVVSTVLFLGMSIVDIFRGHFHSTIVKAIFGIIDNVSDSIVLYVMGAMQTAPFKNQLFPVWAIVLVGFRHSMDFISGYGIRDEEGRRFTEWGNVMKLLGVAFLNTTRGSMFAYPLWSLWGLQLARSYYRLTTHGLAFRSLWHGMSSELVSEYMRTDAQQHNNFKSEDCKAETMEGYRYLVYGETKQHIRLKKPRYVIQIDPNPRETCAKARAKVRAAIDKARGRAQDQTQNSTTAPAVMRKGSPHPESLITLDKIWRCDGALLHNDSTEGDKFKDLSLAFSLSRLLRCRLEDVALHKDSIPITKSLVKLRIIEEEANRAFGVMELEMAFLNDYLNTRYPMVFWCGFPSLRLSLIMSMATFAVACWLSVEIRRVYKTPKGEVSHVINNLNVDMIITWVFMFFMMFKEIWEMVSYLLSDWTRLLLACTYVRWASKRWMRNRCMEKFISSFLTSKISDRRWHGVIDQYVFLQAYGDSPSKWNFLHIISTGAFPKKDEGATLSDHINIPECVKPAILGSLRSLDITRDRLPDVIPSLLPEARQRYGWACFELPTSTHIILVWHIATSLCEIKFAQDRGINLSNPGFPLSALLYVTSSCRNCCAPPYLVNAEDILDGDLKNRYTVANSLSRYCAYLVVSKPYLLPDRFLVPKMVFQEAVECARAILKNADSLDKRYKTLLEEAADAEDDQEDKSKSTETTRNVVQQGAKLAKQLIVDNEKNPESLWEILAGVWADLLVHIAPSWNAAAHKNCFESGGEFITHIWALLCHCGIEKSMLWPVEDIPKSNPPGAPGNSSNDENSSVQPSGLRQVVVGARESGEEQRVVAEATRRGLAMVIGHSNVIPVSGMRNLGNTCYFNAVLQGLLALSPLRTEMLKQDAPAGPLHSELRKLFQLTSGANNCAGGVLETEELFSVVRAANRDFDLGLMEDSNNLLVSILDGLKNEDPSQPTMVESLFHGQVAKHVYSRQCEHTSDATQVLDLSLAIPSKEDVSIEDCLDLYASGEVEDWHCVACSAAARSVSSNKQEITAEDQDQNEQSGNPAEKQNQDRGKLPMLDSGGAHRMENGNHKEEDNIFRAANVQYHIRKAPPILIIQLKRFDYVHPAGRSDKLHKYVSFNEMLDITKLMDERSVTNEEYKYCLAAVVVHEGQTLTEGHNFSYVRPSSSVGQQNGLSRSIWFRVSDENITPVSLEEVLQCQAYILFYEKFEQSKVDTDPETGDSPTNHRCTEISPAIVAPEERDGSCVVTIASTSAASTASCCQRTNGNSSS